MSLTRAQYFDAWSQNHAGIDPKSSPFIAGYLSVLWPLIGLLSRTRVSPNVVTVVGGVVSSLAVVLAALFAPDFVAVIALAGLLLDAVDGGLAIATKKVSTLGGVLDSVFDRIHEVAVVAAVFILIPENVQLVVMTVAATFAVEYARARSLSLQQSLSVKLTAWERPTRVLIPMSMALLWMWETPPLLSLEQWFTLGWSIQCFLAVFSTILTLKFVHDSLAEG